ncbi:MAG: hypothetical protein ACI959_001558 [Limisphaerales bacterium]|jgi:hypothetical protein
MKAILLSTSLLLAASLSAQLLVTPESSDTALAWSLAGPGVIVNNPMLVCGNDTTVMGSGFFNGTGTGLGLSEGVILSSGNVYNAAGPNASSGSSYAFGIPGDIDLDMVPGVLGTNDACALEFDMVVASDTLKLDYVFGSEEYLEFVGAFNDVFAFYLSGPGISGSVNIAMVPGTTDPVSINTVNDFTNAAYYVNNGDGMTSPYDTSDYYIAYDGHTTVLTAQYPVTPGSSYHMKLAVADDLDQVYDSGVFLKWGALGSLRLAAETKIDAGHSLIEGCVDGDLRFTLGVSNPDTLYLDYYLEGSAVLGDLISLPSRIEILPGETEVFVPIVAADDGVLEGPEELTMVFYNPQSGYEYYWLDIQIEEVEQPDFATVVIGDAISFSPSTTATIITYFWEFGDGATSTEMDPEHEYATSGTYEVCLTTTDENGCDGYVCKMVEAEVASGINGIEQILGAINPNPTQGAIQINTVLNGEIEISVFNANGQLVLKEVKVALGSSLEMDLSNLPKGVYNLEVRSESNTELHKVITY